MDPADRGWTGSTSSVRLPARLKAGTAMLAQASRRPQSVLRLLTGPCQASVRLPIVDP